MSECPFCGIVAGKLPSLTVDENDKVVAFVSLDNHCLIIPKSHIPDIFSLDEKTGSEIISELIRVANGMKKGLGCDGIYLTQANGASAGQDTFHLHFHLYPRWNDGRTSPSDRGEIRDRVKEGLKTFARGELKV